VKENKWQLVHVIRAKCIGHVYYVMAYWETSHQELSKENVWQIDWDKILLTWCWRKLIVTQWLAERDSSAQRSLETMVHWTQNLKKSISGNNIAKLACKRRTQHPRPRLPGFQSDKRLRQIFPNFFMTRPDETEIVKTGLETNTSTTGISSATANITWGNIWKNMAYIT